MALLSISLLFLTIGLWIAGVEKVLQDFGRFPAWAVIGVLVASGLNLQVVSFRLWRLLAYFGVRLPFGLVYKANLQGQFASLFLVSLIGQVVGRYWVLRGHEMSSVAVTTLTLIERVVMLLVGGGLCLFGMARLLDDGSISVFLDETAFVPFFATAFLGVAVSLWAGGSKFEKRLITQMYSRKSMSNFLETIVITFLAYGLMLGAFVLAGKSLAPDVEFMDLLAAAAITSFAASMPISIGGWGARELTAVFAFGQVGVPASSAMAVSILIGLCSTAVILAFYSLALDRKGRGVEEAADRLKLIAFSPLV
ncbi:MAG: flippase-like domain-containing protein [Zoogloeaceae bacterium]|nr:flippase-like domain-containing protein [Zoogloeaceae bacterium]